MLKYSCDWCGIAKQKDDLWLLGLAAERVGATHTRTEFHLVPQWTAAEAISPLAVHFCSHDHMRQYVGALFTPGCRKKKAAAGSVSATCSAATATVVRQPLESSSPPAKRRRVARRSPEFSDCDRLRAHALGVRLD